MTSSSLLKLRLLTGTCVGITLCVALFMGSSIGLPQWYTTLITVDVQAELGLFKLCQDASGTMTCITFKGDLLPGV